MNKLEHAIALKGMDTAHVFVKNDNHPIGYQECAVEVVILKAILSAALEALEFYTGQGYTPDSSHSSPWRTDSSDFGKLAGETLAAIRDMGVKL